MGENVGWIEMPSEPECDDMTQFLVHYKATPGFIYTKWFRKGEWYSTWGDYMRNSPARKKGISHWMPLPDSPLEDKSIGRIT